MRSWSIIPAFLANLSADAIRQLAQSGLVRWISWDSPMVKQDSGEANPTCLIGAYLNAYNATIGAATAWNYGFTDKGIAVAVVDSGVTPKTDFLASDDMGTPYTWDDILTPFSAYGVTEGGFWKPELVAPGAHIINLLAGPDCTIAVQHPEALYGDAFLRLSGTSMAAGVASGAVALLLQARPNLSPNQVKMLLMASATPLNQEGAGAGILNVYNAIHLQGVGTANTGTPASALLWTGSESRELGIGELGERELGQRQLGVGGLLVGELGAQAAHPIFRQLGLDSDQVGQLGLGPCPVCERGRRPAKIAVCPSPCPGPYGQGLCLTSP